MYETEANSRVEPLSGIPSAVVEEFRRFREAVDARTLLPWGEHCTECVWPTCYSTCDLYRPRPDGRCRRFVDGMVRLDCPGAVNSYLLRIRFKRWGKLWAPGNLRLFGLEQADLRERRDQRIGSALNRLPLPGPVRAFAIAKRYSWKKRAAARRRASSEGVDRFVVECYNPGEQAVDLSLTLRASGGDGVAPYQKLIHVKPGFHRELIPAEQIARVFDLEASFSAELVPNDIDDDTALVFGLIDFVRSRTKPVPAGRGKRPVKCIVWDLDNTLWDGILVEDGAEKLVLKPGIADILQELDRRGILHSIASKNDPAEAVAVLKRHSLDEYFLHPQISWGPKSEALKTIAHKLNIGIDTLMLVDDSEFELAQVRSACPEARVLEAGRYMELPEMEECRAPATEESAGRRKMYREAAVREQAAESFHGDYFAFLRDCNIELRIESLSPANIERVHELTQRTNQMNFSGNRYERMLLEQIADTPHLDTFVIHCRDRFGSYGIVGFSVVDSREPRMTDLMFSCRVQAKRVEHAFLSYLLRRYLEAAPEGFWAGYRETERNAASGKVFQDIGMEKSGERGGVTSLLFRRGSTIPDDGIIRIVEDPSLRATARPCLCAKS